MRESQKKLLISVSISIVYGLCVLFIGLIIGFFFFYSGINSLYLNKLRTVLNAAEYQAVVLQYGLNAPFNVQLTNYIINFFRGDWGESFIIVEGKPVTELMKTIVPKTVETMLLPVIIGLLGIKLGRIWVRKRNKIPGYIIQIFTIVGFALPIFFIILWLQITFGVTIRNISNGIIDVPIIFYADPSLIGPPFITGFPLFDSIISGNWEFAGSIIEHGFLPMISLSFVILALVIKQTQTNAERNSKDTSFVSNSFTAGRIFGILFAFVLITEIFFNRTGFGYYFLVSIWTGDPFVINGCIFMIIIFFSFTMFFSNMIPIGYKFFRKKTHQKFKIIREKISEKFKLFKSRNKTSPISESNIEVEQKIKTTPKIELKNYIINTLKNPFTIVSLGLIIFLGVISSFPQIFTPYSLQEVVRPYIGSEIPYAPPSPAHPLGTTKLGYDIFARVIYGTRDAFIFGTVVTLIGLAGGSIFGFLAGRLHRYVYNGIIGSMTVFFIIPGLILLIFSYLFLGWSAYTSMIIIGVLQIPVFTKIIANGIRFESNYINALKVIIKYIPLEMAFGILLHIMQGSIAMGDETTAQLGTTFSWGVGHLGAFWAIFWPGVFVFIIILSLILLHEGLKAPTVQRDVLNEPAISS